MSKVAQYLQEHLIGEVMTSPDAREYFSTDASIFRLVPQIIVYPRTENDVRKTVRFSWQMAERGRNIPVTARGSGTDQTGGALGGGIMLVFPAHMNKILTLDSNKAVVTVQPGLNYGKLQQTLLTHGQFLPPFPASQEFSTIGGAIANNAGGQKTIKYGVTKDYVRELRLVLANGEVIKTGRHSPREVNRKMGLATFEGEIYRSVVGLLDDNKELIKKTQPTLPKNTAGYDIWSISGKDGSIDLTSLIVGSQGTLGIVSEAIIETESHNPVTTLVVGFFDDLDQANQAVQKIRKLAPSSLELVDENLLNFIDEHNPNQIKSVVPKPFPRAIIFIEFDDVGRRLQSKKTKKCKKILNEYAKNLVVEQDIHRQEDFWKVRHSAAAVTWHADNGKKALPIVEDVIAPPEKLNELLEKTYLIFKQHNIDVAVWGHAGDANIHLQPFFDLTQVGDRQKIFKIMNAYYQMIVDMGGSTSGEHNDGRLRGPFLKMLYGEEVYNLFVKVKQIFDPYNILNPGVKIDVSVQDLQALMRHEYSLKHLYDYMPHT